MDRFCCIPAIARSGGNDDRAAAFRPARQQMSGAGAATRTEV
ncbi:hypothetical protein [Rhodovulum sulfidophilum]|nr:hypothetical protein [Rhodovulum sulfidophilum]